MTSGISSGGPSYTKHLKVIEHGCVVVCIEMAFYINIGKPCLGLEGTASLQIIEH